MTPLDDDDLRALIDGSFGDGPAAPPLGDLLSAGHRAVRRRRTRVATLALAAVLAVTGGAVALTLDGATTTGRDPVSPATPAPEPDPDDLVVRTGVAGDFGSGELARIVRPGAIEIRDRVEVVDHTGDPLGLAPSDWSVAVALVVRGESRYVLLTTVDGGQTLSTYPGRPLPDFAEWVAEVVASQAPSAADPTRSTDGRDLVGLDDDGGLTLLEGVTLLDRVDGPEPGALAVEVAYGGRTRRIALESSPGDNGPSWSVEGEFADDHPDRTFAEFVARTIGRSR